MVADSTLTNASYLFTLPLDWEPVVNDEVLPLTNLSGLWVGRHKNGLTTLRIIPNKKIKGESAADFADSLKLNVLRNPECTLDSIREYPKFSLKLIYPYKVLYFDNCPAGNCVLGVFVDLPTHVIFFRLEVKADNEESIKPYLEDFRSMLKSFRWTLGISAEDLNRLIEENKNIVYNNIH